VTVVLLCCSADAGNSQASSRVVFGGDVLALDIGTAFGRVAYLDVQGKVSANALYAQQISTDECGLSYHSSQYWRTEKAGGQRPVLYNTRIM
jgi:hypothetical protein